MSCISLVCCIATLQFFSVALVYLVLLRFTHPSLNYLPLPTNPLPTLPLILYSYPPTLNPPTPDFVPTNTLPTLPPIIYPYPLTLYPPFPRIYTPTHQHFNHPSPDSVPLPTNTSPTYPKFFTPSPYPPTIYPPF